MSKNYNIEDLIRDLKQKLSQDLKKEISDTEISRILGMGDRYIYRIRQELKAKGYYSITDKTIARWKDNLKKNLIIKYIDLIELIKKFEKFQKSFPFAQITHFHPGLKYDYFDKINTKEKAYWLGILFADGYIGQDNRLSFSQNIKDKILVYRLAEAIGFNPNRIKEVKHENKFLLRVGNKRLSASLNKHGCVSAKSKIITLPELTNRQLSLAFLIGYFDGDGTVGTSKITSGSLKFLRDIKQKFNIKNKIHTRKGAYDLYLGADLFNEMLDNYKESLPRKRIKLQTSQARRQRFLELREKVYIEASKKGAKASAEKTRIFKLSKNKLKELLSNITVKEIASDYGVTPSTVYRRIRQFGLKLPSDL